MHPYLFKLTGHILCSAFIIAGKKLLTNAHCVEHDTQVISQVIISLVYCGLCIINFLELASRMDLLYEITNQRWNVRRNFLIVRIVENQNHRRQFLDSSLLYKVQRRLSTSSMALLY
jgi:hypothetical protein